MLDGRDLERILEITRQLARPLDLNTMLAQVIEAARTVLRADRGTVFLYDPDGDELFSAVATGTGTLRIPAGRGIVGECARTRSVINVPEAYVDPRFNPDVDRQTGYKTRCLLTVPLVGHDDVLVGVLQVLNKKVGVFSVEDEQMATALGAQCAVALQRARLLKELVAKEKMERELAVARDIQMRFLPRDLTSPAGYDLAGWSRAADETGGDTFDIIGVGGSAIVLLLGDATGHGIGPALSVTQVRSMLRMGVRLGAGLDDTFRHINDQLADDLAPNRFVTAFLGMLDAGSHRVTYHAGGQAPLLWFHAADLRCEWLDSSTIPLGMMPMLRRKEPRVLDLAPGDILGLMTDGIFEYENPGGEQFGELRVGDLVTAHRTEPMSALVERIVRDVGVFASGAPQNDDMTILLVRRLPG